MGDTNYTVGMRVVTSSDDAALQAFNTSLARMNQDLQPVVDSVKKYNTAAANLETALQAGAITQEQYNAALQHLQREAAEAGVHVKDLSSDTEKASHGFRDTAVEIAKSAAELVGLAQAWSFIKDIFRAAAEEEKEMAGLTNVIMTLTDATDEEAEKAKKWVTATALVSAVNKDQLVPGLEKAIAVTGKLGDAEALTDFALQAAKKTHTDFTTVIDTTTRALQTGVSKGQDPYSKALRAIMNEGHTAKEAVVILSDRITKSGDASENTAKQVDRSKISWEETKETLGKFALQVFATLSPAFKLIGEGLGWTIGLIQNFGSYMGIVTDLTVGGFHAMNQAAHLDFKGAFATLKTQAKSTLDLMKDSGEEMLKTVDEYGKLWDLKAAQAEKKATQAAGSLKQAVEDITPKPEKGGKEDKSNEDLAKSYLDLAKAEEEEAKAKLDAAKSTDVANEAAKKAQASLSAEKAAAVAALKAEESNAIESAKKSGASVENVRQSFVNKALVLEKEYAKKSEAIEQDRAKKVEEIEKVLNEKAHKAAIGRADAEIATVKTEQAKLEAAMAETPLKGKANWEKYYKALQKMRDLDYDLAVAELKKELTESLGDQNKELVAYQKFYKSREAADKKYYTALRSREKDTAKEMTQTWVTMSKSISSNFASNLSNMLEGTKTFRDAMKDIAKSILGAFVQMGEEMLQSWIEQHIIKVVMSKLEATAQTEANTQAAAMGAAAAVAPTPFVGPVLAAAAASAMEAMGSTAVGVISAIPAATGGYFDKPTHLLVGEKGPEAVFPARYTSLLDRLAGGQSGNTSTSTTTHTRFGDKVHYHIHTYTAADSKKALVELQKGLLPANRIVQRQMGAGRTTTIGTKRGA